MEVPYSFWITISIFKWFIYVRCLNLCESQWAVQIVFSVYVNNRRMMGSQWPGVLDHNEVGMNRNRVNGPWCRQNKRAVFYVTPYPHKSIYKSHDKIFTYEYIHKLFISVGQVGWDGLVLVVRARQGGTTSSTQPQNQNDWREPLRELVYSKSIVGMKV
jgi:hypothetical protein